MAKIILIPLLLFLGSISGGFYITTSRLETNLREKITTLPINLELPIHISNISFQDLHLESPWRISLRRLQFQFSKLDKNRFKEQANLAATLESAAVSCAQLPWRNCNFILNDFRVGLSGENAASLFGSSAGWRQERINSGYLVIKKLTMPFEILASNPGLGSEEVALGLVDILEGRGSLVPFDGEGAIQFIRDNKLESIPLKFVEVDKRYFIKIDEATLVKFLPEAEFNGQGKRLGKLIIGDPIIAAVSLGINDYALRESRRQNAMDQSVLELPYSQVLQSYLISQEIGAGWAKEFSITLFRNRQVQDLNSFNEMLRVNTDIGIQIADRGVSEANFPEVFRNSKEIMQKPYFSRLNLR